MNNKYDTRTRLGIRLSVTEHYEMKKRASLAGVTLSEYIRRASLRNDNRPLIVADVEILKQIHVNLRRAGSNLNQIARALNTRHNNEWASDDLQAALESLELVSTDISAFIADIRNSI